MEHNPDFSDIEVTELKRVETVGIQSHVKKFSEIKKETVVIGHAQFYDFEDVEFADVQKEIMENIGVGFVFKSSDNNYHVINPIVKSVVEIKALKDDLELDCEAHGDIGLKKGCWTLRAGEKGDKPAPEYAGMVWDESVNLKTEVFSRPHLQYLEESIPEFTEAYDRVQNILNECRCVGDTMNAVKYETHENNHGVDGQ